MRLSEESRSKLAKLPDDQRLMAICAIRARLWQKLARPDQIPPHVSLPWFLWYFQAGRGGGKSRSASEWIVEQLGRRPGTRGFLMGPTMRHVHQVMLQGESGVLSLVGDNTTYKFRELKNEVVFSNGSVLILYTSERQDLFRGNEFHYGWIDEPAELERGLDAWETITPAIRLTDGLPTHTLVTGTPKQKPLTKYLKKLCESDTERHVFRQGSTLDNMSNLDAGMIAQIEARKGTRWYRQEILGELLEDAEDALWDSVLIENIQIAKAELPKFDRKVLAIDPALSTDKKADETGIVLGARGVDKKAYILADYSLQASALEWARLVAKIAVEQKVREVIYERNLAGPLLEEILKKVLGEHAPGVKLTPVHANKSKMHRAEPVSAAYYGGKVMHCFDYIAGRDLSDLESQQTTWSPSDTKSPDRIDALVHLVDRLVIRTGGMTAIAPDRIRI
jgi:phage terminase large subunit-like protein